MYRHALHIGMGFTLLFFQNGLAEQNSLLNDAPNSACTSLYQSTSSTVYQCNKLKVIKIRGNPLERARELGNLHRMGILSNVVLEQFSTKAQKTLSSNKILQSLIGIYIDHWISQRSKWAGAQSQLAELSEFSKASGISKTKMKRALFIPDLGTYAEGETLGCTSAVYSDDSGYLGTARNLDFAGVGTFDRLPAILVNIPDDPREQSYFGVAAEGVPWAGITGMNESGLYFAVHQNFTRDVDSKKALPLLFVGDGLMRKARSMKEALEYLSKNRPLGMWTFVLVDFAHRQAATVEVSARRMNVRWWDQGLLSQSNHLMATPDAREIETSKAARTLNSKIRIEKSNAIMQTIKNSNGDAHSKSQSLMSILAYQESRDGEYSAFRDIQRADTIQSALVEGDLSGAQKLWIGVDSAPTATGTFLGLKVSEIFSKDFSELPQFEMQSSISTPEKRRNQVRYARVYELVEERKEPEAAYELVKSEKSANGLLMKSYLELLLKHPAEALHTVDATLDVLNASSVNRESFLEESAWVLKSKILYEMGRRNEARQYAEQKLAERRVFSNPDRQDYLKKITEKLERPYGKNAEEVFYRSPGALKWNFAFGDFRQ